MYLSLMFVRGQLRGPFCVPRLLGDSGRSDLLSSASYFPSQKTDQPIDLGMSERFRTATLFLFPRANSPQGTEGALPARFSVLLPQWSESFDRSLNVAQFPTRFNLGDSRQAPDANISLEKNGGSPWWHSPVVVLMMINFSKSGPGSI